MNENENLERPGEFGETEATADAPTNSASPEPVTSAAQEPARQTPAERLHAAHQAFEQANQVRPGGLSPFQLPPFLETAARTDALARVIIDSGLTSETEYGEQVNTRMAEMIEEMTDQVRELKRRASGLILAGPDKQL